MAPSRRAVAMGASSVVTHLPRVGRGRSSATGETSPVRDRGGREPQHALASSRSYGLDCLPGRGFHQPTVRWRGRGPVVVDPVSFVPPRPRLPVPVSVPGRARAQGSTAELLVDQATQGNGARDLLLLGGRWERSKPVPQGCPCDAVAHYFRSVDAERHEREPELLGAAAPSGSERVVGPAHWAHQEVSGPDHLLCVQAIDRSPHGDLIGPSPLWTSHRIDHGWNACPSVPFDGVEQLALPAARPS